MRDIVRLHLLKGQPKVNKTVWQDNTVEVTSATGSMKSMREWGKAAFAADGKQRRAFEILIASFLLTFCDEKPEDAADATTEAGRYPTK